MKQWRWSAAILAVLLVLARAAPVAGQVSAFRYDPSRVPVGQVFHYLKSNQNGTDLARGHLVEFRMPVGDEPGYTDGWMRLTGLTRMTPAEWAAWKRRMVGE